MTRHGAPALVAVLVLLVSAAVTGRAVFGGAEDTAESRPGVELRIQLADYKSVQLEKRPDGSFRFLVGRGAGAREHDPAAFAAALYRDANHRTWWQQILNVTSPIGIAWVALGFLGQALFTGRMLIQWFATERRRVSVVPELFWWLSIGGASMLLVYFIWRRDIVGILGQSTGWIVYARNLYFIHTNRGGAASVG